MNNYSELHEVNFFDSHAKTVCLFSHNIIQSLIQIRII